MNDLELNKDKLIEFYRLFFKQHYSMEIPTSDSQIKIVEKYENQKYRQDFKCPIDERYTQQELDYLIAYNLVSKQVTTGTPYGYYQPVKRSLTANLLQNLAKLDLPINIDRFLNLDPAYGVSITFKICEDIMLFKAIEDEAFVGFFAVSDHGTLAVIINDKLENKSQVLLTGQHAAYGLLFKLYHQKNKVDIINKCPTETHGERIITIEDYDKVFKIKTGGLLLSKYIEKVIEDEKLFTIHDIKDCKIESVSSYVIEFLANRKGYRFDLYSNNCLEAEKLKIWFMLNHFIECIEFPESNISDNQKERALLHSLLVDKYENNRLKVLVEIPSNIDFNNESLSAIKGGRIIRIKNLSTTTIQLITRKPKTNKTNDKVRYTNIIKLNNGNAYIFEGNRAVGCYGPDKEMEEFDGIINDDYAFQLLEWRYVGQTTIIEPTAD
ncbi:TPA: hypothetical protein ACJXXT_000222 [Pseudomonas aeruginosa]